MSESPHILIVGYGSAGQRHARNLARRGARISVVEVNAGRVLETDSQRLQACYGSVEEALRNQKFDGGVIATPTVFHLQQTLELLGARCPVLLEKPVALDAQQGEQLLRAQVETGIPVLLGYTWRWWPALREMRTRLRAGAIGKPVRAEFVMASHLEDWHPGEPLSQFFMSRADLGGGALLDESHWIDQMLWLLGPPAEIAADIERVSELAIDSDDHVELRAFYPDGLRVRVHLDLYSRPTERSIAVYGNEGALQWSFESAELRQFSPATSWQATKIGGERNDMFDAVASEFLHLLEREQAPSCGLADGLDVMRVIEAARMSHARGGSRIELHGTNRSSGS